MKKLLITFAITSLVLSACVSPVDESSSELLENPIVEPVVESSISDPTACSVDADCVVKNVGNCCGYFPGCVNTNFEPDLDTVARECEESGIDSVCGFPEVSGCECVGGSCRNIDL